MLLKLVLSSNLFLVKIKIFTTHYNIYKYIILYTELYYSNILRHII